MFFILLTFAAALFIEGLGSLVSVIGISALFGANPIIIALAISLDVGKIVVVSLLYTHWNNLSVLMRGYALVAATITMIITSAGAAGYLSGEFQKAILHTKEGEQKVAVLKEQQSRYQERKKQIDDQIANLPPQTTVNQRLRLMRGFQAEQRSLDKKITEIDNQLPELQLTQIGTETKAGPILYVAKAFRISVEEAVKWVILLIIFVFDPLAIFLIVSGNFLWARRKAERRLYGNNLKVSQPEPEPTDDEPSLAEKHAPGPVLTPTEKDYVATEATPEEVRPTVVKAQESTAEPVPKEEPEPEHIEKAQPIHRGILNPITAEREMPTVKSTQREHVNRSSFDFVPADPATIVDAKREIGFIKPKARKS